MFKFLRVTPLRNAPLLDRGDTIVCTVIRFASGATGERRTETTLREKRGNGLQHIACPPLHIQLDWSIPPTHLCHHTVKEPNKLMMGVTTRMKNLEVARGSQRDRNHYPKETCFLFFMVQQGIPLE